MKKKTVLLLIFTCIIAFAVKSQTLYHTYYDYQKTHVEEEYYANSYGVKNGLYKKFSEYGGVLLQGTYKNNISVGKWITYNDNGKLFLEENYDNDGKYNGQVIRYDMNGIKYRVENYKHAVENGNWKEWYYDESDAGYYKVVLNKAGNPMLHTSLYYKDGVQDSIEKYYNGDGSVASEENYSNGKKNGKAVSYAEDKPGYIMREGYYRNDTAIGEWRMTFDNKNQKVFKYTDADHYQVIDFGENGNNKILKLTTYYMTGEKRSEETICYWYTISATGRSTFWSQDVGNMGQYIEYYKNGQIAQKGAYKWFNQVTNLGEHEYTTGKDSIWDTYSISGKDSIKQKYISGRLESTLPGDNK